MTITPYAIPGLKTLAREREDLIACDIWGVTLEQLYSNTRKREVVDCRNTLMYYFMRHKNAKCVETGLKYNKDHATALRAPKVVPVLLETDSQFKVKFDEFIRRCDLQFKTQ